MLLAEDNVLNQRVATLILEGLGYKVQIADNGQRAIDAIDNQRHHQPQEHHAPLALDGGQHGKHRQHRAGGGQQVDGQGFDTDIHVGVIA